MYLWFKLLHVFFVISWFAGLLYLPRLFVNLAQVLPNTTETQREYQRLLSMADKLWRFMTPWAILAVVFGLFSLISGGLWQGWSHSKITLGVILLGYHFYCWRLLQDFREERNIYSPRWFRVYGEIPTIILAVALYLVVFKPF